MSVFRQSDLSRFKLFWDWLDIYFTFPGTKPANSSSKTLYFAGNPSPRIFTVDHKDISILSILKQCYRYALHNVSKLKTLTPQITVSKI